MEDQTLTDVFFNFYNFVKDNFFCFRFGKIISFIDNKATVSLINDGGDIHGVPVCTTFGNSINLPIKTGDVVVVGFCDDNFFKWINVDIGEKSTATHEKSNAFILCGIGNFLSIVPRGTKLEFNEESVFKKTAEFDKAVTFKDTAEFDKAVTFKETVEFDKAVTFKDTAEFDKAVTFKETVTFEKAVTFKGTVTFEQKITAKEIDATNITATAVKTVAGVDLGTHVHPAIGSPPTPTP